MLVKWSIIYIQRKDANIIAIVHDNGTLTELYVNVIAIVHKKNTHLYSYNYKQCQFSCNHQENIANKKANANIMVKIVIYNIKSHTRDILTGYIKKIDAYITAFVYAATTMRK